MLIQFFTLKATIFLNVCLHYFIQINVFNLDDIYVYIEMFIYIYYGFSFVF